MSWWPLGLYRVSGHSMLPTCRPGDVLVGWRWFRPQPGQVVIAQTPQRCLVKRVVRLSPGQAWLEGDNAAESTDSRSQGLYPIEEIKVQVIAKLRV